MSFICHSSLFRGILNNAFGPVNGINHDLLSDPKKVSLSEEFSYEVDRVCFSTKCENRI